MRALQGVDFDVAPGEVHCLLGPNGAGQVDADQVRVGRGRADRGRDPRRRRAAAGRRAAESHGRAASATIYQELDLVEDLTRRRERLPRPRAAPRPAARPRARCAARRRSCSSASTTRHLPATRTCATLRPAAQQVVSIARALSRNVRLLIMDEPSSILDDGEVETLFGVVRRLTAEGVGVDLHLAPPRRDPAASATASRCSPTGARWPPACRPTRRRRAGGEHGRAARSTSSSPSGAKRGGDVAARGPRRSARPPDVRDVSFQVHAGEVVGIGGLVGAGRTELLRLIYGLDAPDAGEVVRRRQAAAGRPARRRDRRRARASRPRTASRRACCSAGAWPRTSRSPTSGASAPRADQPARRAQGSAASSCARSTPCRTTRDRLARELSGGNQQKVVLARWLLRECRVLLLDEPTRGVDVGAKAEIYRLIAELAKAGIGVLVVSSETGGADRPVHAHPGHARGRAGRRGRRRVGDRVRAAAPRRRPPPSRPEETR